MSTSEKPQTIWFDANCHCAAIRYKVNLPPLESVQVMNCNCSICCKNGYLNVYPNKKDIIFQSGEDLMKGYLFGERKYTHKFCPNCGSSLFVDPHMDGSEMIVVNVRMIKDIELDKLKYRQFDGKTRFHPQYDP